MFLLVLGFWLQSSGLQEVVEILIVGRPLQGCTEVIHGLLDVEAFRLLDSSHFARQLAEKVAVFDLSARPGVEVSLKFQKGRTVLQLVQFVPLSDRLRRQPTSRSE